MVIFLCNNCNNVTSYLFANLSKMSQSKQLFEIEILIVLDQLNNLIYIRALDLPLNFKGILIIDCVLKYIYEQDNEGVFTIELRFFQKGVDHLL